MTSSGTALLSVSAPRIGTRSEAVALRGGCERGQALDERRPEPPAMVLEVSRFVFAPAVGLVNRRVISAGARGTGVVKMCVDIIHVDNQPAARR